jgi:hypothetical protein
LIGLQSLGKPIAIVFMDMDGHTQYFKVTQRNFSPDVSKYQTITAPCAVIS